MKAVDARKADRQVSLALVHHANQYLITDGYEDREGMSDILGLGCAEAESESRGLLPLLQMHLEYRVPLNLHLSGTFIEGIAWHYPESFSLIKQLRRAGLLDMIGSAFSQNIMPFFSDEYNLRQVNEELWLYRYYLGLDLSSVRTFWVPERVWDTQRLARLLRSDKLLNKGYSHVLLDARLIHSAREQYQGSARERFDREEPLELDAFQPWQIVEGHGLVMLPISRELRYLIPAASAESRRRLSEIFGWLASSGSERAIAVYGDDLEKAAGVGGWDHLHLERYGKFLRWLVSSEWIIKIRPVLISAWAQSVSPAGEKEIEPGTFYELAQVWKAGEDYRGWFEDPNCFEHRQYVRKAEQALIEAEKRGAEPQLLEMGWKHLLHCSYETSWHDPCSYKVSANYPQPENANGRRLAGWAAALPSHARSCFIIAKAAEWARERDSAAHAQLTDINFDGEQELVLTNERLFAVFSPLRGGRLTWLFDLTGRSGRLVIGNISDDWNLQEELNRYMDRPRNHPGALAEVGHEHDQYETLISDGNGRVVNITLRNIERESSLYGAEKRIRMSADAGHICVSYHTPQAVRRLSTEVCFSPDYYRLLRYGRHGVAAFNGPDWRGWSNGLVRVWMRIDRRQSTVWDQPHQIECGHGLNVRVTSFSKNFNIEIGVGTPPPRSYKKR